MSFDPAHEESSQPLLPRFGMVWFFILVILVSMALFVVRAAEQGEALARAMVFCCVFFASVGIISGACFVVAFLFGAMERAVGGKSQDLGNPFIDGTLPDQILPPRPADSD